MKQFSDRIVYDDTYHMIFNEIVKNNREYFVFFNWNIFNHWKKSRSIERTIPSMKHSDTIKLKCPTIIN